MITGDSGPAIGFGIVDHYTPPPWPDENSQKQFHLDLKVDDIAAAEAASQELGATRPEFQPGGDRWRVHARPGRPPVLPDPLAGLTGPRRQGRRSRGPGPAGRVRDLGPEPAHRRRGEQRARPGHRQPTDRAVRAPTTGAATDVRPGLERRADQVARSRPAASSACKRAADRAAGVPSSRTAAAPGRRPRRRAGRASAALPQPPRQAGARSPTRLSIGGRTGPVSRCRYTTQAPTSWPTCTSWPARAQQRPERALDRGDQPGPFDDLPGQPDQQRTRAGSRGRAPPPAGPPRPACRPACARCCAGSRSARRAGGWRAPRPPGRRPAAARPPCRPPRPCADPRSRGCPAQLDSGLGTAADLPSVGPMARVFHVPAGSCRSGQRRAGAGRRQRPSTPATAPAGTDGRAGDRRRLPRAAPAAPGLRGEPAAERAALAPAAGRCCAGATRSCAAGCAGTTRTCSSCTPRTGSPWSATT